MQWNWPESKHLIKIRREKITIKSQPIDDCLTTGCRPINADRMIWHFGRVCECETNHLCASFISFIERFWQWWSCFCDVSRAIWILVWNGNWWRNLLFAPRAHRITKQKMTEKMDTKQLKIMPCDTTCIETSKWHGKIETTIIAINTSKHRLGALAELRDVCNVMCAANSQYTYTLKWFECLH